MNTKHTPGPWYVEYVDDERAPNADSVFARATLIAAAPELLEALLEVRGLLISYSRLTQHTEDERARIMALQMLGDVLRKATGWQP